MSSRTTAELERDVAEAQLARANLRIARLVEQRAQNEAELRAVKAALRRCVQVLSHDVLSDIVATHVDVVESK